MPVIPHFAARRWGAKQDIQLFFDIGMDLATACGSTGWVYSVLGCITGIWPCSMNAHRPGVEHGRGYPHCIRLQPLGNVKKVEDGSTGWYLANFFRLPITANGYCLAASFRKKTGRHITPRATGSVRIIGVWRSRFATDQPITSVEMRSSRISCAHIPKLVGRGQPKSWPSLSLSISISADQFDHGAHAGHGAGCSGRAH